MSSETLIHVIDDDAAMRESLAFLLESAGYAARTYDSAMAFLAYSSSQSSGCIVTDVRMPGMTGIELTRQLRSNGVNMPIVMITGHGDVPLAVESMKAGRRRLSGKTVRRRSPAAGHPLGDVGARRGAYSVFGRPVRPASGLFPASPPASTTCWPAWWRARPTR